MASAALEVKNLVVRRDGLAAVRGVSLTVGVGQRVGLVGESGAGKSMTAMAVMGLLPPGWSIDGEIVHNGTDLAALSDRAMSRLRGRSLSMVFQNPLSALNPTKRVGEQIADVIERHTRASAAQSRAQVLDLMHQMQLPRVDMMVRSFPHELSGGQRQRIMIAMALACHPSLIIADEPTTALDVTVQKQVLRLMDDAVRDRGSALLMITHDLPVIAALCDTVAVMYGGRIVEMGPVASVFRSPRHHYTRGLLDSQPTMANITRAGSARLPSIPGMVPPLADMPTGCAFRTRCPAATSICATMPELDDRPTRVACWHPLDGAPRERPGPTMEEPR